ncbi:MAG TPA: hypothetical protein ENG89_01875 [Candidatus Moranbacteria bacterium]|nr:hypothetical protein [Candidatus Moranbacteria bacterium]
MKIKSLKLVKKVSLFVLVISEIFLINTPFVYGQFDIPSASEIAAELEERYHLNLGSIQDFGEGFNVSSTKNRAPEVSIFFEPANPKPGEEMTATALPIYFSNPNESLYYTWYIRHNTNDGSGYDGDGNFDWDDDGNIDEEDWKIAAMRQIVKGRWDPELDTDGDGIDDFSSVNSWYNSQSDNDNDGYKAILGGADKEKMPNHCYLHDFDTGENHEIVSQISSGGGQSVSCSSGSPLCGRTETEGIIVGGNLTTTESCVDTGENPLCLSGTPVCSSGTPVCTTSSSNNCSSLASPTCSGSNATPGDNCEIGVVSGRKYKHLFPRPNGTGNGSFGLSEEKFWVTDPNDPDTADNKINDEATLTGLGQAVFIWNYQAGDEVGVVVEGSSMIPTKYDDASMMIMWAFSKNKCQIPSGEKNNYYIKGIKGYNVKIPITSKNLNSCLEANLVDPTEGGQANQLDVSLSYSPENPVNDPSGDEMGDVIFAQASSSNSSREESELHYEWDIELSKDGSFSGRSDWADISDYVTGLGSKKGNGLSSVEFQLNLSSDNFPSGTSYTSSFPNGIGYIRVNVVVREYFSNGKYREGYADVIIKVISSDEKVEAFNVSNSGVVGSPNLQKSANICNTSLEDRSVCFVVKNEIIGVEINKDIDGDGINDLSNFSWTIDGSSLDCDRSISSLCEDDQHTNVSFFPVIKNPGETYTVGLRANNITSGQTTSLVKTFQVVDPYIKIVSADGNVSSWPKLIGSYSDLEGNLYPDYNETVLQTFSGTNPVKLKAEFHPAWIEINTSSQWQFEWLLDGLSDNPLITSISDSNSS